MAKPGHYRLWSTDRCDDPWLDSAKAKSSSVLARDLGTVQFITHSVKPFFKPLIVSEMHPHQAFPKLAVIGHGEVQQFVDNHIISQAAFYTQQFIVEAERTRR